MSNQPPLRSNSLYKALKLVLKFSILQYGNVFYPYNKLGKWGNKNIKNLVILNLH